MRIAEELLAELHPKGIMTGSLPVNVGSVLPKIKIHSNLTERYLSEEEVIRMITLTPNLRDRVLIKTLYAGVLRVSELLGLNWEHIQNREEGSGHITVLGKGSKKRVIVLLVGVFQEFLKLIQPEALECHAIFQSREEGGHRLSARMAQVIIDQAGLRAGILKKVSPCTCLTCP